MIADAAHAGGRRKRYFFSPAFRSAQRPNYHCILLRAQIDLTG